jgi:hypothetical protein
MGLTRLRAFWFRRQGLMPRITPKTAVDCLRQAGWLATAGSTGVYLSMRARLPGISREAIDRAAMDGVDVIEVPGAHARPPLLVPRDEMALALRLHSASYRKHVAPPSSCIEIRSCLSADLPRCWPAVIPRQS